MPHDWNIYRNDFPVTKNYAYLANAAVSPIPVPVYKKVLDFYSNFLDNGSANWMKWMDTVKETRSLFAKFIGADSPEEIAFTHSTSEGMNIIAHMLSEKGIVISNELEFPATNLPWLNKNLENIRFVKAREGKKITIADTLDTIENFIEKNKSTLIKTIVTSHVQYATGFRQDLKKLGEISKQKDLYFVVNPTQSLGALYFNVKEYGIDFMASNGHKWILSSFGIGTLYIRKKFLVEQQKFLPPFFSQSGQKNINKYDLNNKLDIASSATRFEVGTPPIQNITALNAALKYLTTIGISEIEHRILDLTDYLISKLNEMDYDIISPIDSRNDRSGIIVFKSHKKSALDIVTELENKYNVIVSARGSGIRVSPHFYNNEEDIDQLLSALKKINN